MKASQLVRGNLQISIVPLPLAGSTGSALLGRATQAGLEGEKGAVKAPAPVEVGLLPLSPGDEADIFERARAYAVSHGLTEPKEGDELYEYGKAIHRCLIGVIDPDSPRDAPQPFFDGGLEQLCGMPELGRDGVLALAEMHRVHDEEVHGRIGELNDETFRQSLEELGGPFGGPFFCALPPGFRVSLAISMARLLSASLAGKSSSGSDAGSGGKTTPRQRVAMPKALAKTRGKK